MSDVLIICPGQRDRLNLSDERILERFGLRFAGAPVRRGFDPLVWADQIASERPAVDGVFGSNDATGHLAAVLGARLGLPGPTPDVFLACLDKLECRRHQARSVPDATPEFAGIDVDRPGPAPLRYPFFVKPVAAHLSQLAYRVDDDHSYARVLAEASARLDGITAYHRRLAGRPFRTLIAEQLLSGRLVTFEGFMHRGRMTPIGVTDTVVHPNGTSFLRFEYPSSLAASTQDAMAEVAERLMPAMGFDDALFNVEFFVDGRGGLKIVEVNPRMASQFAPLVAAVHGVSSYELALSIATGGTPELPPAQAGVVATSFVQRTYEDAVVRSVPDPTLVTERFGHAHVEILVRPGQLLSENDDDVVSHRLAVVALAGPDRAAVERRYRESMELLSFELEPVVVRTR